MNALRQRDPRAHDGEYKGWIAKAPCIACLVVHARFNLQVHVAHLRSPSAAHGKRETGGAEKPSDVWSTPLCPAHHTDSNEAQHQVGEQVFWEGLHVDPFDLCIALEIAFREGRKPGPVIIKFAAAARRRRPAQDFGI